MEKKTKIYKIMITKNKINKQISQFRKKIQIKIKNFIYYIYFKNTITNFNKLKKIKILKMKMKIKMNYINFYKIKQFTKCKKIG